MKYQQSSQMSAAILMIMGMGQCVCHFNTACAFGSS